MDLDDFTEFWQKRSIILKTYGQEFNQYLHDIQAPAMSMLEYECLFWEWYNERKQHAGGQHDTDKD